MRTSGGGLGTIFDAGHDLIALDEFHAVDDLQQLNSFAQFEPVFSRQS